MGGWGGWLAGWLDQVGIRLTQLSTGLKVEAELGNNKISIKDLATTRFPYRKFYALVNHITGTLQ